MNTTVVERKPRSLTQQRISALEAMLKKKAEQKENRYISLKEVRSYLGISTVQVYTLIRRLREKGVGVYSRTGKGYILAEAANRSDDVNLLRKIHGRRTSDLISLNASLASLRKRWAGTKEEKQLDSALEPLIPQKVALEASRKILLEYSEIIEQESIEKVKSILSRRKRNNR